MDRQTDQLTNGFVMTMIRSASPYFPIVTDPPPVPASKTIENDVLFFLSQMTILLYHYVTSMSSLPLFVSQLLTRHSSISVWVK